MKKTIRLISVLTVAAMLLCLCTIFASAKTVTYMKGDADGDNKITVLDATTIQKSLASLIPDPDGMIALRGEIAGDVLDITDATYIQKYLAQINIAFSDVIGTQVSVEVADPTEDVTETPSTEAPTTQEATYPYDEYELPYIPSR